MYRFYVDALLYFGSIRTAFQTLRGLSENELNLFFEKLTINKDSIINRGPALDLNPIAKDERYLISEMACKSYELGNKGETEITQGLLEMYRESQLNGHRIVSFRQLLEGDFAKKSYNETQSQFQFAAVDIMDEKIQNEDELRQKIGSHAFECLLCFSCYNNSNMILEAIYGKIKS
jgi:hypothetical protein